MAAQRVIYSGVKKHKQQVQGGDSSPLLSSHESSPEILHPALESSVQERWGFVGLGREDGYRNDEKEERLKELGLFNLEKTLGRSYCGLSIPMVEFKKKKGRDFLPGPVVEDKVQ